MHSMDIKVVTSNILASFIYTTKPNGLKNIQKIEKMAKEIIWIGHDSTSLNYYPWGAVVDKYQLNHPANIGSIKNNNGAANREILFSKMKIFWKM